MRRTITLILLFVLLSGVLMGCYKPDTTYLPYEAGYKWVCDEIDMWFLLEERGESRYCIGELTLDGETKPIEVIFFHNRSFTVDDFAGFDDLTQSSDKRYFDGYGKYYEEYFTLKVREDYIDYVGFEKLTFRRVELDEEDLAWLEAEHPELLPDVDELGADQTASP